MTRNFFIFLATFTLGALGALVTRAAMFKPHSGHETPAPAREYAQMVTNPLTPAKASDAKPAMPAPAAAHAASGHEGHGTAAAAPSQPAASEPAGASDKPVNTICAICGMKVNPSLPTEEYQGKRIGFGCRMCPPKFKADPDRYGPYYLRNETIKR